jgi:O-antigen ligase
MVGAYNMFQEKPITGWGYGNFDLYDRSFYGRLLEIAGDNKDHSSHNYFLSILAEQGLVGLSLYLLPMFIWFFATLRQYPNLPTQGLQSRNLIVMLWLVILFHLIVSNFINMIVVYGLGVWWITLGLIGHLVQSVQVPTKAPASASLSRAGKDYLFVEESVSR